MVRAIYTRRWRWSQWHSSFQFSCSDGQQSNGECMSKRNRLRDGPVKLRYEPGKGPWVGAMSVSRLRKEARGIMHLVEHVLLCRLRGV